MVSSQTTADGAVATCESVSSVRRVFYAKKPHTWWDSKLALDLIPIFDFNTRMRAQW